MQPRKAKPPSQQNRKAIAKMFDKRIAERNLSHLRAVANLTEAPNKTAVPVLKQGSEGTGKDPLLQDLDPNLWSWFDNNCKTYAYVPLHRKDNYIKSRSNVPLSKRDVKKPDILPEPKQVAYRYRACNNWTDRQRVLTSRSILQDSDEYVIEALTRYHQSHWFEVHGMDGELLQPEDSIHPKVHQYQQGNAMEEDHRVDIDDELKLYCNLAAEQGEVKATTFYHLVQEQRIQRQSKLRKYHSYKLQKAEKVELYLAAEKLKPKYKGKPSCPKPECMIEEEEILREEMGRGRHSAATSTVLLEDIHPTLFIGYDKDDQAPLYHSRLKHRAEEPSSGVANYPFEQLSETRLKILGYRSRWYLAKGNDSFFLDKQGLSVIDKMKVVRGLRHFLRLFPYMFTMGPTTVSCTSGQEESVSPVKPTIVEGQLHDNHVATYYMYLGCASRADVSAETLNYLKSCEVSIDKHAKQYGLFRNPIPVVQDRIREAENAMARGAAKVIAESIVNQTLLKSSKDVDNLDLFKKRKGFTKQIYIEPDNIDSQNKNVIITLDKESALQANEAVIKEVINDQDLFQKILGQVNACPACGKGE